MSDGLFPASVARTVKAKPLAVARCGDCGLLDGGCRSPKMPREGEGRKRILVVEDFPGNTDDEHGRRLAGSPGMYLRDCLYDCGIDMRKDCFLTSAARCHPPGSSLKKWPEAVKSCRPYVLKDIEETSPTLILLLGRHAVRSVVGHLWGKEDTGDVDRWAGAQIPAHRPNCWVAPTYHPWYVLQQKHSGDGTVEREFRRHLRAAVKAAAAVPWPDGPPEYEKRVEVILSPEAAAARLRRYTGGLVAFDYETSCLKPDDRDGEIVCASVCWEGQETIAFPWHGPVISEMGRLLADPNVGKIMQNAAFEIRWTLAKLGAEVVNCVFDTMLAAHAINPRERAGDKKGGPAGVTGLKFMAFARLGQPSYNDHIEPFLDSKQDEKAWRGCYAQNRVREIDIKQCLKYCALDSLLEYELALILADELGVKL